MSPNAILRLRRDLSDPLPAPVWPEGVRLTAFAPERHAQAVHALLVTAYARGGGSVDAFDAWWPSLETDAEYDPALCLVAEDDDGRVVGVAQCWTSAFIKDLAVAPAWRRRGLGSALLLEAFRRFRERGAAHVDLKVEADNPSGAVRLYRAYGMRDVAT